ncbi:MAG TPA: hypothetical protein VGE09_12530 [Pseudoxanthomonas sp.]
MHLRDWTRIVRFALVVGAMALTGCRGMQGKLETARAETASTLPSPYLDGLVTESVAVEGDRLVFLVRSPDGDAEKTRAHPRFRALRESEQQAMTELCALPAMQPLIGTDAVLVRRFVDRDGALFFESILPARECAAPPA